MEKGKISALQMAVMIYPTIVATIILIVPNVTAKYAKNDLWLTPILASVIGYVTVYLACKLHQLYPKQTVIQFSEQIVGRFAGKMLGVLFLLFYIQGTGHTLRSYSEFIVESFLGNTPISVIIALMAFLCALIVSGGLEGLGRAAQLFLPIFIIPLLILIILVFPDFEFKNILPILGDGIMPPIKGAIVPSGWFTELFMISFFLPFLVDGKKGMKYGMMTTFAVMMTLVMVNFIVLFVLGPTIASRVYPLMQVARYISIANFFEHLESIVMAIWVVGAFIKISVFYYVAALGTAQWLNLSDYRPVVWPLGIIIVAFSFWSLPSTMESSRFLVGVFPFYGLLIQTIIPLFLLATAVIQKRKRKVSGKHD
jgi:spore germination protein KB